MKISMNSLMLAIKAIQRDIDQREALLNEDELSDDDADYQGQYVMDLTRALGEIGDVYERSRGGVPEAPSLETLLGR
jgi:NhaP-type Na+/H+ and K+/H+ antiporter